FFNGGTLLACPNALKAKQAEGWEAITWVSGTCVSKTLMGLAGSAADGAISLANIKDPLNPKYADDADVNAYREAVEKYRSDFKDRSLDLENAIIAYGWTQAELFVQALEAAEAPTRLAVMDAIRSLDGATTSLMLDGVSVSTSEDDQFMGETFTLIEYDGAAGHFNEIGELIDYEGQAAEFTTVELIGGCAMADHARHGPRHPRVPGPVRVPGSTSDPRPHEHVAELLVGLHHPAGAEHHRLERLAHDPHRHLALLRQPKVQPLEQRAAADEVDAVLDEVLRELGRRLADAGEHRVDDRVDRFGDGLPHLRGGEDDGLGEPGHQLAAPDLGAHLVGGRVGGADEDLDLLRRLLADRDAVLPADVGDDRRVDVEGANAHRLERDDAAERDQRGLGGAAADVDDHVRHRLVDRQPRPDRRGHRLLDQLRLHGAGLAGRLGHRPLLDRGDRGRHADDDAGTVEPVDADPLEQQADHLLGHLEVGDRPFAQRPHGDDVARGAPDHLPGVAPHRQHLVGAAVERDDRGLVQDDALTPGVHQRVRGAQVDREVACQLRLPVGPVSASVPGPRPARGPSSSG